MNINLRTETPAARRLVIRKIKTLWATHHFLYHSKDIDDIAKAVNASPKKIELWAKDTYWKACLDFWNDGISPKQITPYQREKSDLNKAFQVWRVVIENGFDLFPCGIENEPKLNWVLRFDENRAPQGTEAITPFTRVRDWIITAPTRLKYAFWAFYVSFFV